MCRKKKVRSNVRMCAPSTSASVMMITLPFRRRAGLKSSFPTPVPRSVIIVRMSCEESILSIRAFSTFRIFPFKGRIAWYRRSRACFAEPPAESPSTRKSSHRAGSVSWQSASFPGEPRRIERPLSPRQFLRLARRLPRPGGLEGLLHDLPGDGRRLLEEVGQLLVDQRVHDPLHFAVPQTVLRLPIALGLRDFDGDAGGQPFSQA